MSNEKFAIGNSSLLISAFDDFIKDWTGDEESREIEFDQDLKDALESSE